MQRASEPAASPSARLARATVSTRRTTCVNPHFRIGKTDGLAVRLNPTGSLAHLRPECPFPKKRASRLRCRWLSRWTRSRSAAPLFTDPGPSPCLYARAGAQRTLATLDTSSVFLFAECNTSRTLLPFFNFEVRTLSDSFLAFTDLFFKIVVLVAL